MTFWEGSLLFFQLLSFFLPLSHLPVPHVPCSRSPRLCPPAGAPGKSCKIPVCFNTEISAFPASSTPLERREPFPSALSGLQSEKQAEVGQQFCGMEVFGTLQLAEMPAALPGVPEPCCDFSPVTRAWLKGSVGSGFGQVMPEGAVYCLAIVAVGGYSLLLKSSSERNHIDLVSLAETSVNTVKRESMGDTWLAHRHTSVDAAALQCCMFTCLRQKKRQNQFVFENRRRSGEQRTRGKQMLC